MTTWAGIRGGQCSPEVTDGRAFAWCWKRGLQTRFDSTDRCDIPVHNDGPRTARKAALDEEDFAVRLGGRGVRDGVSGFGLRLRGLRILEIKEIGLLPPEAIPGQSKGDVGSASRISLIALRMASPF
jgi:hypothetical protein